MANIPISSALGAASRNLEALNTTGASEKANTNLFQHLMQITNQDQVVSDQAIQDFVLQKPNTSVQQVVMAVAEAEMSFQFFMEVRNKLIDSYNELMRMQF